MRVPDDDQGQPAHTVESFTGMLGWHSVGVFDTTTYADGETLHVNSGSVFVMLTDPAPEYREFVFLDDEFHHASTLLAGEYEAVFADHFEQYGTATIYPATAFPFLTRNARNIPDYDPTADPAVPSKSAKTSPDDA